MNPLVRTLSGVLMLGVPLALMWLGRNYEPPAKPPRPPQDAPETGELLLLPFRLVGGLAALCWLAVALGVFLAPLLALAWLVVR